MHYKDLTQYEYYLPFKLPNVFNIGWLDSGNHFENGSSSPFLLEKLEKILLSEGRFESRVNPIRGVHPCNLCDAHKFSSPFIGSCELWIPSQKVGEYFAAPSLVIHYILEHDYCPPNDFVESVLQLDMDVAFNGQQLYDDLMQANSTEG